MADTGSIGLAFGAALIGLGAVFAAFLALRIIAALITALKVGDDPNCAEAIEKPAAQKPATQATASAQVPVSASQGAAKAAAPTNEVVAAIGAALSFHGAGDEVVAAIATALFLEGVRNPAQPQGATAQRSLWSSAGKIDSHDRRVAVQARQKR